MARKANLSRLYTILQPLAIVLLVIAFAAPWIYGPIGKRQEYGWQPVWTFLTLFIPLNVFIVGIIANAFCYLELYIRQGRPVLEGALRWIGGFLFLVIVVPAVVWLLLPFDLTQRSPTPTNPQDTLGWGVWLALAGLIIQIIALRIRINGLKIN